MHITRWLVTTILLLLFCGIPLCIIAEHDHTIDQTLKARSKSADGRPPWTFPAVDIVIQFGCAVCMPPPITIHAYVLYIAGQIMLLSPRLHVTAMSRTTRAVVAAATANATQSFSGIVARPQNQNLIVQITGKLMFLECCVGIPAQDPVGLQLYYIQSTSTTKIA